MKLSDVKAAKGLSSEKFFGLVEQPSDTCPLIDKAMDEIKSSIAQLIKLNDLAINLPYPDEDDGSAEEADFIVDKITEACIEIPDIVALLKKDLAALETFREACEDYRGDVLTYKKDLWSILDELVVPNEKDPSTFKLTKAGKSLIENFGAGPQSIQSSVKLHFDQWGQKLDSMASLMAFEVRENKELQKYAEIRKQAVTLMPQNLQTEIEPLVKSALANFDKMTVWNESLNSFVEKVKSGKISY